MSFLRRKSREMDYLGSLRLVGSIFSVFEILRVKRTLVYDVEVPNSMSFW